MVLWNLLYHNSCDTGSLFCTCVSALASVQEYSQVRHCLMATGTELLMLPDRTRRHHG